MSYATKHLFSQHLFSADLFGGDPMKLLAATALLYKRKSDGKLMFVEKLPVLQEEAGVVPLTDAELERIRSHYGAGTYEILYSDSTAQRRTSRVIIGDGSEEARKTPAALAFTLPAIFREKLPLHQLFGMLLSALGPEDVQVLPPLAHSIIDGWFSTLALRSTRVGDFDAWPEAPAHPWLRMHPTFLEMSDTEIYRAYVAGGLVVDRDDIREHLLHGISRARVMCDRLAAENQAQSLSTRNTWYLWLDDERNPKIVLAEDNGAEALGERYAQYQRDELTMVPWRWARSVEQAIWLVEKFGCPRVMSLDHDLGGDATSMQFVRWLADEGHHIPKTYVHSANPVGRENILSFLRSYMRAVGEAFVKSLAQELDAADDDLDFAAEAAEAAQQQELAEELAEEEAARQSFAEETV